MKKEQETTRVIDGKEVNIGDRVRLKINLNDLKEGHFFEINGFDKNSLKLTSIFLGSRHVIDIKDIDFE